MTSPPRAAWAAGVNLALPEEQRNSRGAAGALRRLRIPNRIGLIALSMLDNGRMRNDRGGL